MEKIFSEKINQLPNTLKNEHLREDVKPIMACVGSPEDLGDDFVKLLKKDSRKEKSKVTDVNFASGADYVLRNNLKNAGGYSYVMSSVDDTDKFSKWFANCLGIVSAGVDNDSGENISFLSHQYPKYFLFNEEKRDRFLKDLLENMEELTSKCQEGSVDIVIFGGNYLGDKLKKDYADAIKFLTEEMNEKLGFEPVVIVGPKTIEGNDNVYYKNDSRRLYILRPEVGDESTEPYSPKELERQKARWI